jgi:hypothetical protein
VWSRSRAVWPLLAYWHAPQLQSYVTARTLPHQYSRTRVISELCGEKQIDRIPDELGGLLLVYNLRLPRRPHLRTTRVRQNSLYCAIPQRNRIKFLRFTSAMAFIFYQCIFPSQDKPGNGNKFPSTSLPLSHQDFWKAARATNEGLFYCQNTSTSFTVINPTAI